MEPISEKKIKLAIIADDKNLTRVVWECLRMLDVFELAGVARANRAELGTLFNNDVDVFLLDIALSAMEDNCFFQAVAEHYGTAQRPACVAFYPVEPQDIDYGAFKPNVDYFIQKPFDVNALPHSIISVYNGKNRDKPPMAFTQPDQVRIDVEGFIGGLLNQVGVRSTLKGYTYLKCAISHGIRDRELTESITKVLYHVVAKEYQTTPTNVERAIRHAIEDAGREGTQLVFGAQAAKDGKMTNGKFIKYAVEQYYNGVMSE